MRYLNRVVLYIIAMVLSVFIIDCDKSSDTSEKPKEDSKEAQIKKSFEKTLNMCPIKNLGDLYDKEGSRDGEFRKGDKGMWAIYTDSAKSNKQGGLSNEGMVLCLDRSTRTAKGHYFVKIFYEKDRFPNRKKYKIEMKNNKTILLGKVEGPKLKKRIENFKFLEQYANLKELGNYNSDDVSINENVPSYDAKFKMSNKDENVKQLRSRYNIPTDKAPVLEMYIDGNLKGSSVGYEKLETDSSKGERSDLSVIDSLNFQPAKVNENDE